VDLVEPDAAAFRTAISHFATGVTVVTATGSGGPAGMTANAVCSLSLEPLLMIVCLDLESRTLRAVRESGRLAVNILEQGQQEIAVSFASKAAEEEKFRGVGYRELERVPVLDGVVAWLIGEVREFVPGGDHLIGVAEVTAVGAPGGEPLLYYRSGYHSLGA
jgi:3-hydroxy-9,10-secoandrosta-1,3,5(10)-triene-9,17-dione monooxygenase reductase component